MLNCPICGTSKLHRYKVWGSDYDEDAYQVTCKCGSHVSKECQESVRNSSYDAESEAIKSWDIDITNSYLSIDNGLLPDGWSSIEDSPPVGVKLDVVFKDVISTNIFVKEGDNVWRNISKSFTLTKEAKKEIKFWKKTNIKGIE